MPGGCACNAALPPPVPAVLLACTSALLLHCVSSFPRRPPFLALKCSSPGAAVNSRESAVQPPRL